MTPLKKGVAQLAFLREMSTIRERAERNPEDDD